MENNVNKKEYKFLSFTNFTDINSWDVKRHLEDYNFNFRDATILSKILKIHKTPITHQEVKKRDLAIISKIDFGGNLYLRDKTEIETYKGNLFLVPPNSIIYSKINVKHGCIYFNKHDFFAVSNEYPCFTFDSKVVNGEFLIMLLRSQPFKNQINSLTVGIGKSRVKVGEFLSLKIPLSPLSEQQSLVQTCQSKVQKADLLKQESNDIEKEKYLDQKLGIETKNRVVNTGKLSFIEFNKISKWGLDQIFNSQTIYNIKYNTLKIEQLCSVGSGGTPSRSNKAYYKGDIPWIKTGEVINDIIYNTEEKISNEAIKNSSAKIYPKDSLIIAMYGQGKTRGRTAKLGVDAATNQACAVLYNIKSKVLVDYLWVYLMNEYKRLRALASGNNQPNLNADMIKNYPVVVPPINIQEKIIDDFFKLKTIQKQKNQEADRLQSEALTEFENTIFNI